MDGAGPLRWQLWVRWYGGGGFFTYGWPVHLEDGEMGCWRSTLEEVAEGGFVVERGFNLRP